VDGKKIGMFCPTTVVDGKKIPIVGLRPRQNREKISLTRILTLKFNVTLWQFNKSQR
jgi:hypothetical protein